MQNADLPFPVPTVVRPTVASVVAPLAVGLVVTVLAALTPARVATRVAPIAALRPADAPAAGSRAGRFRLVVSLVLVVGGALLLAGGVALSQQILVAAVGIAILGGAASFVGLLVGAVFWMPRVVAAIGGLVGRLGMPARLAAANTGRNPARTAATSTALLIGVTLVAMMSTGAVTARATLDDELDTRFPGRPRGDVAVHRRRGRHRGGRGAPCGHGRRARRHPRRRVRGRPRPGQRRARRVRERRRRPRDHPGAGRGRAPRRRPGRRDRRRHRRHAPRAGRQQRDRGRRHRRPRPQRGRRGVRRGGHGRPDRRGRAAGRLDRAGHPPPRSTRSAPPAPRAPPGCVSRRSTTRGGSCSRCRT